MRLLVADYIMSSGFKIPSNVPLLSTEENDKAPEKTPWSWWVKWDKLHYYNDKGEICEIEPDYSASDFDFKYPSEMDFDEVDTDDDE